MTVIRFSHVSKGYPIYRHVLTGFKSALLSMPEAIRSFRQEQRLVLEDVSFEIRHGETIGLIGSNGSGKSTTLALIAGVLFPQAGRIEVEGRICPLLELGAGFVFDLSGRENVILNGVLLGLTRREIIARLDEIIAFSELQQFMDQPLRTYSTGMIARLGFSIAVHLDPEVLLIDEILSVGDLHFQLKCNDKIDEFKREQVTIVLVSHSIDQIQRLCDRVIWLAGGRVVGDGPPHLILPQYRLAMLGMEVNHHGPVHACREDESMSSDSRRGF
jgi:lipopolysaccharide transport system ATP-binding protein